MVPAADDGQGAASIDAAAAARALGVPEPFTTTPIVLRRGKGIWRVDASPERFVLRVLRPDEHDTAERERRVMGVAAAAGLRVPEVVASGTWERRPVQLLSWCTGRTLQDELRARPWDARRLGRACGATQATLHACGLDDAAGPSWVTRFGPVDDDLARRLAAVDSGARQLLHLDLHPTNVLVARGSVSALLDWTNAAAGDPRADLARALSLLTAPPQRARPLGRVRAATYRVVAAAWRSGYEEVAGPQEDMALFELWAAAALVRIRIEGARWGGMADVEALEREVAARRARIGLPPVGPASTGGG